MPIYTLAKNVTANGTFTNDIRMGPGKRTAKASIAGTGAVSATVELYGNHDSSGVGGGLVGTFSLTGTASDTKLLPAPNDEIPEWPFYYVVISNISGTGAAVTFTLSVGGA